MERTRRKQENISVGVTFESNLFDFVPRTLPSPAVTQACTGTPRSQTPATLASYSTVSTELTHAKETPTPPAGPRMSRISRGLDSSPYSGNIVRGRTRLPLPRSASTYQNE